MIGENIPPMTKIVETCFVGSYWEARKLLRAQSDERFHAALAKLAQCLTLLRKYLIKYGMPERGGPRDQEFVLRNVVIDLYAGGAPIWALEEVIQKAAEGLTGSKNVNWFILPRKAFVCSLSSGTTNMFTIQRGFSISKLSAMEKVRKEHENFSEKGATRSLKGKHVQFMFLTFCLHIGFNRLQFDWRVMPATPKESAMSHLGFRHQVSFKQQLESTQW
jgi:hypothetical protein